MATSFGFGEKTMFPEEFCEQNSLIRKALIPGSNAYNTNNFNDQLLEKLPSYT